MPNPYHFRARIDRIAQQGFGGGPGYLRVKALDTLVRELHAPNDRARANYRMYLATDPYEVARHKLRDLYDQPNKVAPAQAGATSVGSALPPPSGGGRCLVEACPALDAGTEGGLPLDAQPNDEDDDPL